MLKLKIKIPELWDEKNETFISAREITIQLEHSLVSLSKWESKWKKAFLDRERTPEETIDYIRCMTITQNVDPDIYNYLSEKDIELINNYITDPMTATFITEDKSSKSSGEIVTSELIYYWMIVSNIPFECQKWHLNRLLMLIRVCGKKSEPAKKQSKKDTLAQYAALNAARRKRLNTKG